MIRLVPRLCLTRLASLVFLACPGRLRQIRLAIHAGLDGDPPIRIIDRRYDRQEGADGYVEDNALFKSDANRFESR